VRSARPHKGNVIALLEGVDDVNAAMLLKNKVVSIARADAHLPEGSFFLADIIGLDVVDEAGHKLGILTDILSPSVQQIYVVKGEREIMIPAVPEFILETNVEGGYLKVRLIEGM
jgi:16S rRNA processing protein RimM